MAVIGTLSRWLRARRERKHEQVEHDYIEQVERDYGNMSAKERAYLKAARAAQLPRRRLGSP